MAPPKIVNDELPRITKELKMLMPIGSVSIVKPSKENLLNLEVKQKTKALK